MAFAEEPTRAKGRQSFAPLEALRFQGRKSFVRMRATSPRAIQPADRAARLITTKPLADRGYGGGEQPRGGFEAALFGTLQKTQAMVVGVFHLTYQIAIASGGGHGRRILPAARRPAPPPPPGGRPPRQTQIDFFLSFFLFS